jgi:hypothetical protein
MRRSAYGSVCLLLGACGGAPELPPAPVDVAVPAVVEPVPDPFHARAEAARAVMVEHCGLCHVPEGSRDPRALAIFDLDEDDWTTRLDARQLADIETRLVDGEASYEDVDAVRDFLVDVWQRREALLVDC